MRLTLLGPLLRGCGRCIGRRFLSVREWNRVRVQPILKRFEFTLVPVKAFREIVCGLKRNKLVVSAEVDGSGLDTLPVKLVVELNVADVTDGMEVGVASVADWVTGVEPTDHHTLGNEDGQNKIGGVMVKFWAGTFATSIYAQPPPICGCVELRAENVRHLAKLERPQARLDDI